MIFGDFLSFFCQNGLNEVIGLLMSKKNLHGIGVLL